MKCFVGLDLSLTGAGLVALDDDGELIMHDVFGERLTRDASQRDKIERLVYISGRIMSAIRGLSDSYDEVLVGIEGYAFSRNYGAMADLGEVNGSVKTQLWLARKIVPDVIAVTTARKYVFGKGNFKKKDVRPELITRGYRFIDDNDADAYVIAECLRRKVHEDD